MRDIYMLQKKNDQMTYLARLHHLWVSPEKRPGLTSPFYDWLAKTLPCPLFTDWLGKTLPRPLLQFSGEAHVEL